jgi:nitroreductase
MGSEYWDDPVLGRRTVNHFTDTAIEEKNIYRLIQAAMSAPSVDDERPWHFIVVQEVLKRSALAEISPYLYIAQEGPASVIVCGDESLQKQQGCWVLDCSAATQNMLIEAQVIDLGAIWLRIYPVEGRIQKVRSILNIPQHIIPFSMVVFGHPADEKAPLDLYDPERIHREIWTGNVSEVQQVL